MPTLLWTWSCSSSRGESASSQLNKDAPNCASGAGTWVQFTAYTEAEIATIAQGETIADFDVSQLTVEELTAAWSAGFTVMAIGLVIVAACKALLRAIP